VQAHKLAKMPANSRRTIVEQLHTTIGTGSFSAAAAGIAAAWA